ncbi:hypothetical protein [Phaffia rhodozyma]|uniref:Uncharacterized protein n=1 Tax=Phaffia rhodozyma TaxID=264483 RepID=A0A0F7SPE0_PHARH|nr:hypothetical protein [Phaffia rhodozyma]
MGRLRGIGRSVSEVMAWGMKTGGEDSEDEGESGHADRFHPSNFPLVPSSIEPGASRVIARRAPSISSQTSRTFELAINAIPSSSALDSHPISSGPSGSSNRRRRVDAAESNAGSRRTTSLAPLGPSASTLYPEPRRPARQPSGRFVAPDVRFPPSVSSSSLAVSPTQIGSPASRNPSWASSSSRPSPPQTPRPVSPSRPSSPTQSALSYLNAPSLVSFPSRPESVHGEPVESFGALPGGNHRAILLQRLGDAEEAAEEDPRLAQALGVLLEMGYVGSIGSAGNTRPNGESDRFVFVQSAPVHHLPSLSSPARSATPDDRPTSNRRTSSNLTSTTASGSGSSPASRGRPRRRAAGATRRSTRSNREPVALAQANPSPASSTRSRNSAVRSSISELVTGHGRDHSSPTTEERQTENRQEKEGEEAVEEPIDESDGRNRVVSNPRPRRRRRPDGPSPLESAESVSVSSLAETTSSYSTARSNTSLPTPSPEIDSRVSSRSSLLALDTVQPSQHSLIQTVQDDEDIPIALRRTPRSSTAPFAPTSARIGRTRNSSNASSSTSLSQPPNNRLSSGLPTPITTASERLSPMPLTTSFPPVEIPNVDPEAHPVSDCLRTSQVSQLIPPDVFQSSSVITDPISSLSTSGMSGTHESRAGEDPLRNVPGLFELGRGLFEGFIAAPSSASTLPVVNGEFVGEGRGMTLTRSRSNRSRRRLSTSGGTTDQTNNPVMRGTRCSTVPPLSTPSESETLPTTTTATTMSEYVAHGIQPRLRTFLRSDRPLSTLSTSARAIDSTPFLRNIRPPTTRSRSSLPSIRTSHPPGPTTVSNFTWTPTQRSTVSSSVTTTMTASASQIPASPTHTLLSLTSTMSSENDLPLDRNPPPAYERSLGERAEYVAPPPRPRRGVRQREEATEGNSMSGLAGRLLGGGTLRDPDMRPRNSISRGEGEGENRLMARGRSLRGLR